MRDRGEDQDRTRDPARTAPPLQLEALDEFIAEAQLKNDLAEEAARARRPGIHRWAAGARHRCRLGSHAGSVNRWLQWFDADDTKLIKKFADANRDNIAEDHSGATVFLARNDWQLNRAKQDFPQLRFLQTRERAPLTQASA